MAGGTSTFGGRTSEGGARVPVEEGRKQCRSGIGARALASGSTANRYNDKTANVSGCSSGTVVEWAGVGGHAVIWQHGVIQDIRHPVGLHSTAKRSIIDASCGVWEKSADISIQRRFSGKGRALRHDLGNTYRAA